MKLTSFAFAGLVALAAAVPGGDYADGKPKPPGEGYPPYPPPGPPNGLPPPPPPDHGKPPPPPPPEHKLPPLEHKTPPPPPEHKPPRPENHGYNPPPPPSPPNGKCAPGTYSCTTNPKTGGPGWQICNTSGQYEYGGDCPPNTGCKFFEPSRSPYCVPPNYNFP